MEAARMHMLIYAGIALFFVALFWMFISSPTAYYSYAGSDTTLRIVLLVSNGISMIAFLVSIIGSILGYSALLSEKLATRLTIIALLIGLILLANSVAIYVYNVALQWQPHSYY